jgi:murein L,D-transpeptidase YafK
MIMWTMTVLGCFLMTRTPQAADCPPTVAALAAAHPEQIEAGDVRLQSPSLIVVRKSARAVLHYASGTLSEEGCWVAGLGFAPESHKQREGDGRTPEGWYRTSDKPWSQFYGAIAVHYPNTEDAAAGVADGRISAATRQQIDAALRRDDKPPQTSALGGEILLHGGGSLTDWTLGCVAMNNSDIDSLRAKLPRDIQADVLILP